MRIIKTTPKQATSVMFKDFMQLTLEQGAESPLAHQ